jgi:hypothetical protein
MAAQRRNQARFDAFRDVVLELRGINVVRIKAYEPHNDNVIAVEDNSLLASQPPKRAAVNSRAVTPWVGLFRKHYKSEATAPKAMSGSSSYQT